MNIQNNRSITPLRQRMIEDMAARKLGRHSQRSHLYSCKRFAALFTACSYWPSVIGKRR